MSTAPATSRAQAHFNLDEKVFREDFDREPFGFTHNLSGLDLFQMDSLRSLARLYQSGKDCFVASGASTPGTQFYAVPKLTGSPADVLEKLDQGSFRILLKRPEQRHPGFRELIDTLFKQVIDLRGGLGNDRVVRLDSSVFISSASTTTPFHFDPEIAFFCQIAGEKIYHVYSRSTVSEQEMEKFFFRGVVDIAQVDLAGRDAKREHVFNLAGGKGLHQPQNSPHWVLTGAGLSVSYSFVYETVATRNANAVRAYNRYLRTLGMNPTAPGINPGADARKVSVMRAIMPAQRLMVKVARKVARKGKK